MSELGRRFSRLDEIGENAQPFTLLAVEKTRSGDAQYCEHV